MADMLREAEENLGEGKDSPFPDAQSTEDDGGPSEGDETSDEDEASEDKGEENK